MRDEKGRAASTMDESNNDEHALGGLSNIDQPVAPTVRAPLPPVPLPAAPAAPATPTTPPVATPPPAVSPQVTPKPRDTNPVTPPVPTVQVRPETSSVALPRRAFPQFRISELSGFRAPKSFRIDTSLLSYVARHELYRQALHDKRPFTDKLNEWIKQKMEEEDRILQLAEADVRGIEAELLVNEAPETFSTTPETPVAPAMPTFQIDSVTQHESTEAQPESVAAASPTPPPQKKGPDVWEVARAIKSGRARGTAGNL